MNGPGNAADAALIIDDSACTVYAREIRNLLGVDMFSVLVDSHGNVLWTDDNIRAGHRAHQLRQLPAPSDRSHMQPMSANWCAYQLPIELGPEALLALRLVLHDDAPPELNDLEFLLGQTLECFRRQLQIDSSLTSATAENTRLMKTVSVPEELITLEFDEVGLPKTMAKLCRRWRRKFGVAGVAVNLRDYDLLTCDSAVSEIPDRLQQILRRIDAQPNGDERIVKARLRVTADQSMALVTRNIVNSSKRVIGNVMVFDTAADPKLSRLARQLSTRLGQWLDRSQQSSQLVSRSELIDAMAAARRDDPGQLSSLVYFDADKIHAINDAFGYSAGDRALEALGRILVENRGQNGLVSHLGSDRFVLFLPGATCDKAVSTAQRALRHYAAESIDDEHRSIGFSASAGVATMSDESDSPESLLIVAEVAARAAKDRGGNQYALHQDVDDSVIQRRSDVDKVGFMQMALIENRFILFAQKISALGSDRPDKYELLTRLEIDGNKVGHPGEMLSAAERYHMMTALDRWVVNNALYALAGAENLLDVNLCTFCINVSAQSLQDDTFIEHIEARIAETGVAADTLCFEITETSLVRNIDRAQRFISRLQRLGCQIALDDFGTGYSSFAYLKNLPVNYLKIDGSFVRDMPQSQLSRAIVASIVNIAAVTGAATVAEHVESDEIRKLLLDLGVDYVQGFAIHRPEPLANVLGSMGQEFVTVVEPDDMIDLGDYTQPLKGRG